MHNCSWDQWTCHGLFGNPLGALFPPWNWKICGCSDPALFGLWAYHKSLGLGDALLWKRSPRRAWSKENVFAVSVPAWLNHRAAINKEKETAGRKLITWNCPFPPFPFSRMVQCIICMFLTGQFWYILMQSLLRLWSYHCFLSKTAPRLLCNVAERVSWAISSHKPLYYSTGSFLFVLGRRQHQLRQKGCQDLLQANWCKWDIWDTLVWLLCSTQKALCMSYKC